MVEQRPKAVREVSPEIGDGHFAAQNESNRRREEPDENQIEVAIAALNCALGVKELSAVTYITHASELTLQ